MPTTEEKYKTEKSAGQNCAKPGRRFRVFILFCNASVLFAILCTAALTSAAAAVRAPDTVLPCFLRFSKV